MSLVLSVLSLVASVAVAQEALRDGLYDVARRQAEEEGTPEAQAIIVESYAREGNWDEVLARATNGYYRALALYSKGEVTAAREFLGEDDESLRLKAGIESHEGNQSAAISALKSIKSPTKEDKLFLAELYASAGSRRDAERLWREVGGPYAALNLEDETMLLNEYAAANDVKLKRQLGLKLGECRLNTENAEDGIKLIETIVHDSPDAPGAFESSLKVADYLLAQNETMRAEAAYQQILDVWPEAKNNPKVFEGRGWAQLKDGRTEQALSSFERMEALSTNMNDKAIALVKMGDALSQLGRGEEAMNKYRQVSAEYGSTPAAKRIRDIIQLRELEMQGKEYYRNYNFAEAQKIFDEVGSKDASRKSQMEFYKILCLYGQGRDQEAAETARKLDTPAARLWLAKYDYNVGAWNEAAELFKGLGFPEALLWSARASLAANEYQLAIDRITLMLEQNPEDNSLKVEGMLVQGQALLELARFDEAVLLMDRALQVPDITSAHKQEAMIMKGDALLAMGTDNPIRYEQSLATYRAVRLVEDLDPSAKIVLAFKIGRALDKLKKLEEAIDQYYTEVVIAYRTGRKQGINYNDDARAAFSRAAFRLVDEYESAGREKEMRSILKLIMKSDVPAAEEATRRYEENKRKGRIL